MPGLMIDSDDVALLLEPRFAGMRIATYSDLVTPQVISATTGRLTVIDRGKGDPHHVATVADIEAGALSPAEGIDLIRGWIGEGRRQPTAYHDRSLWAAVNDAGRDVAFAHWVATMDGTLVPDGFYMAVVQFAGEQVLGFHADMSIVWADNWHPVPHSLAPVPVGALRHQAAAALASVHLLNDTIDRL